MKKGIIIAGLVLSVIQIHGQRLTDAVSFTDEMYGGTARSVSMGSSVGAFGGDFSSLSVNPAGVGVYRSNEFVFTTGFFNNNTKSNFFGNVTSDKKYNFNVNNIGYVGSVATGLRSGVTHVNLAIGYNRSDNLHSNYYIGGINPQTSFADFLADEAYNQNAGPDYLDAFFARPAYDAYVLELDSFNLDQNIYFPYVWGYDHSGNRPSYTPGIDQIFTINTEGRQGEFVFSGGINISNIVYWGATIGIKRYVFEDIYKVDELDVDFTGNNYDFTEQRYLTGAGYTFKTGLIVRPLPFIRVGAALHIPTFYRYTEEYSTFVNNYMNGAYARSSVGVYDYRIITPFKLIGSAGVQFGKIGLLSVEYETQDYSSIDYRDGSGAKLTDPNNQITSSLGRVHNIRVGSEVRVDMFSFRVGGAYYTSPYTENTFNLDNDTKMLTAGFGIGSKNVYFDVGYSLVAFQNSIGMYSVELDEAQYSDEVIYNISKNTIINHRVLTTIGFRF